MIASLILLAIQCLLIGVFIFGDIGFDRPGRFGLDFDDFLLLAVIYFCCLITGLIRCMFKKQWTLAAAQLLIPISILLAHHFYVMAPGPHLNVVDNQYLIGKTKAEVHEALSHNRRMTGGFQGDPTGSWEVESYNGIQVYYSEDGHAIKVNDEHDFSLPAAPHRK